MLSSLRVGLAGVLFACVVLWMFALQPSGASASANANWGTGVQALLPANAGSQPFVVLTVGVVRFGG